MTLTATMTETITAENIATLFPDVDPSLARSILPRTAEGTSARDDAELQGYDEEQIRLMDEVCIVLDENDNPIGSASKKTCKTNFLYLGRRGHLGGCFKWRLGRAVRLGVCADFGF